MNRITGVIVMIALLATGSTAQSVRSLINEGNDLYEDDRFDEAEIQYRKALQEEDLTQGKFNLGNALHKQGKFQESVREFEAVASGSEDAPLKADALFNRGNSLLESKEYDAAIQSYVESLKLNPADDDAKYNLSYAIMKRQEQEQQNNQQNDQKQDNQQQNQNQQQQEQQQEKQDRQEKQDQNQGEPQDQREMSKAEAERILQVLKNNEKDVQKKLRSKSRARAKSERDW